MDHVAETATDTTSLTMRAWPPSVFAKVLDNWTDGSRQKI
jgi:hypothetical protein